MAQTVIDDDFIADNSDDDFIPDNDTTPATSEPSDWTGGFLRSLFGGEALKAGAKGALGFTKGAVLDIPETFINSVTGAYNAIQDPIGTVKALPQNMSDALSGFADSFSKAGSDPEQFGRMMGQLTGQGAATAGIVKGVPPAIRMAGTPVAATGRIMNRYAPITGVAPPIMRPPTARLLERGVGYGIEALGEGMKKMPDIPFPNPTLFESTPDVPVTPTPKFTSPPAWNKADPNVARLNELTDKFTRGMGTGDELIEAQKLNKIVRGLEPTQPSMPVMPVTAQSVMPPAKPKLKATLSKDGSRVLYFTNEATGEIVPPPKAAPTNRPSIEPAREYKLKGSKESSSEPVINEIDKYLEYLKNKPVLDMKDFDTLQKLSTKSLDEIRKINKGIY